MSQPSARTLAIVDDPTSVQLLMEHGIDRPPIDGWLALTPPAAIALGEQGITYITVDDCFAEADLLGNLDDRLNLQFQWAAWVDQFLQARIPAFAHLPVGPAITFFYRIKSFFDRLRVHCFGLEAFLSHYSPQKVLWAPNPRSIMGERHLIGGHYVDMILPILARERGVELTRITFPEPGVSSGPHLTKALGKLGLLMKKQLRQVWVRASIRYEAMRLAGRGQDRGWGARLPRNPQILVLQNIYDMRYVMPELQAAGVRFAYPPLRRLTGAAAHINPEGVRHALATAWEEISRAPEFWSLLEGWEAGREVAQPWLFHLWHRVFLECWTMFEAGKTYLRQKNYHGVIIANSLGLKPYAQLIGLVQAARSTGIPIFSAGHGALPGYCHQPAQVFWDMPYSDYHLAYGPGVAEYLNRVAARYSFRHATAVSGGSPRIDAIRMSHDRLKAAEVRRTLAGSDARPLILYIPDFLYYHRRLSGDASACMPYFALQKQIIDLVSKFSHIRIIYRAFAGQWPGLMPHLAKLRIPDAVIATPKDFKLSELMWAVDGIILDYPATPLAEILLTDKPMVVFADNRYFKMLPEAKALLRKRVQLADTPGEYLSLIKDFLQNTDFDSLPSANNGFRQYYVTDADDGQSGQRFADCIMRVMAERD